MIEDEIVGWHHQLSGHEFEETPGDSEGQGSLTCCSPWPLAQHLHIALPPCFTLPQPHGVSKASLWMKAQHEGALTPPGIVRRNLHA